MLENILSIIYSLYFNLKYLSLKQALRFPIKINYHTKIRRLKKGNIIVNSEIISFGMIRMGISKGSFNLAKNKSTIYIEDTCRLVFNGVCSIDGGFSIVINKNGEINIGKNVHFNANAIISSSSLIKICDNVGTGWDCTFMDWDGHDIINLETNKVINNPRHIIIDKNCWIGSKVTIMKGTVLCNNTIIPYGSIITKKCDEPYCVFGGSPNHILRTNIARKDKL